jgi:predicted ArsR family transcriptional regulator
MTPSTRNRILNYLSVLTEWTSAQQVAKGIGTTTRETGQHLHLLWLEGSVEYTTAMPKHLNIKLWRISPAALAEAK